MQSGVNVTLVAWMINRRRRLEERAAVQPLEETSVGCAFLFLFGMAAFTLFGATVELALRLRRRDTSAREIV